MKKMLFCKIFNLLNASLVIILMAEFCLVMVSCLLLVITCRISDAFRLTETDSQLYLSRDFKIRGDCLCFMDAVMQAEF
jgi:hypothetical protein